MKRVLIITLALLALVALAVPAGAAKPSRVTLTATLPWPTVPAPLERDVGAFVNFEGDVVRFNVVTTVKAGSLVIDVDGDEVYNGVLAETVDWTVPTIPDGTTKFVATATVNGQLADTTEAFVDSMMSCGSGPVLTIPTDTTPNAACVWRPAAPGAYTLTNVTNVPSSMKRFTVTIRDHAPGDFCYQHEFRVSDLRTGVFWIPAGEGDCAGSDYDTDPYTWRDANPANFIVLAPAGSTLTLVGPSS